MNARYHTGNAVAARSPDRLVRAGLPVRRALRGPRDPGDPKAPKARKAYKAYRANPDQPGLKARQARKDRKDRQALQDPRDQRVLPVPARRATTSFMSRVRPQTGLM